MKSKEWIDGGSKKFAGKVTPHSGGENRQLGGYDGRDRIIAQPNGVNRTATVLQRPGAHVPAEKKPEIVRGLPSVNDGPNFRSGPQVKIGWKNKNYLKSKG